MSHLLDKIDAHIAQMAPHQKERDAGRLLIEARDELRKLEIQHHVLKEVAERSLTALGASPEIQTAGGRE